jgi:hypothetical protein
MCPWWRGTSRSVRIRAASAVLVVGLVIAFAACVKESNAGKPVDPSDVLRAIPAADFAQYDRIADMKNWRNPYLIVRPDGVVLFDAGDHAEIHLKLEEVVPALAKLPASAWPYGRVVAVSETTEHASEQDAVAIRRNKGIVGGMLQDAKLSVKWVPAA